MQQNENFAKQAEQAEVGLPKLERPKHWGLHGANFRAGFKAAEAQHESIVGALRAKADQLREALEWRKENQAGQRELLRSVTAERDAALARAAELAQALRHLLHNIKASGKRIDLGLAKECAEDALARIDSTVDAQAQHSVPEGYALVPVRETEAMHDAVMALLYKGVARTDTQKLLDAYIAAAPGKEVPQAWLDVQAERRRQINVEGWTPEHDDKHETGALASAAGCYAMFSLAYPAGDPSHFWPWDKSWWKPSPDGRRNIVKAGALILAEIERLDRAAASQGGPSDA